MAASLGSAPPPPVAADDHLRGSGPEATVYLDLGCPRCASAWERIVALPLRICARHFPVAGKRPRSPALHAATEAAGSQSEEAFWAFWDSLLAERGHTDDPHLWERAEALGLDLDRFDRDRRSPEVAQRVRRDFKSGIRAGIVGTPAGFADGVALGPDLAQELAGLSDHAHL